MIAKKRRGRPDREAYRRTYKLDWTSLGSERPQCGGKHRNAGPPHRKLIQIQKLQKVRKRTDKRTDGRMDGRTDGQTYYTATQGI